MGYAIKTLNASLRSRSCKHSLMVKLALSWIRDPVTSCKPLCPACADDLRSAGGHSQQPINADYHSAEAKEKKRDPREAPVLKPNEQKRSTCKMNCVCVNLVLISSILLFVAQPCCCLSAARAEQRALPRVACSGRRMRAVFGPMVKANIHVQGTYEAGKGLSFLSIAFVLYCVCAVCLSFPDKSGARIPVLLWEGSCGVRLGREKNQSVSFFSRYDSCYAHREVQANIPNDANYLLKTNKIFPNTFNILGEKYIPLNLC